jgi:hypothetical protein
VERCKRERERYALLGGLQVAEFRYWAIAINYRELRYGYRRTHEKRERKSVCASMLAAVTEEE